MAEIAEDQLHDSDFEQEAEEREKDVEIPEEIPVLPVRDIVVFPYMILPLFVGRDMSIKAIEEALETNKMILLLTQRDMNVESPGTEDLSQVGAWHSCEGHPDRNRVVFLGEHHQLVLDHAGFTTQFDGSIGRTVWPGCRLPAFRLEQLAVSGLDVTLQPCLREAA